MLKHDFNQNLPTDEPLASAQPPDVVIYRFIRNSVDEALQAGADTIQFSWRSDGVGIVYRKGESVLETHNYPSIMSVPLQQALSDWKKMAAPHPIQIDFPDKVAVVHLNTQTDKTILNLEVLTRGI